MIRTTKKKGRYGVLGQFESPHTAGIQPYYWNGCDALLLSNDTYGWTTNIGPGGAGSSHIYIANVGHRVTFNQTLTTLMWAPFPSTNVNSTWGVRAIFDTDNFSNRKHFGLFLHDAASGTACTGYRIAHIDTSWNLSKYSGGTETGLGSFSGEVTPTTGNLYDISISRDVVTSEYTLRVNGQNLGTKQDWTYADRLLRPGVFGYGAVLTYLDLYYIANPVAATPGVVAVIHFNGPNGAAQFIDTKGHNITVTSATLSTTQAKFGNASGTFAASSSAKIALDSHADFGFGTGNFQLEAWIYPTGYNGDFRVFAVTGLATVDINDGYGNADIHFYVAANSGQLNTYNNALSGGGLKAQSANNVVPTNQWVHVAFTRVNGVLKNYVNGVEVSTGNWPNTFPSPAKIDIGYNNNYPTRYIDDVKISRIVTYTGNFTPPAAPHANQ